MKRVLVPVLATLVLLWHALYNMTSATAASRGVITAVTTTCVMVWATIVSIAEARRRTRRSGLLVERA